jgi:hypothetical protein
LELGSSWFESRRRNYPICSIYTITGRRGKAVSVT